MNQGIPFARTIRALDADSFRGSKLGLLLAAVVLACWIWWALAARVPRYELSTNVQLDPSGQTAVAYFTPHAGMPIRAGEPAILRTGNSQINAAVTAATTTNDGQVRVELEISPHSAPLAEPNAVELEIERISPVTVVLRAAGIGNPGIRNP